MVKRRARVKRKVIASEKGRVWIQFRSAGLICFRFPDLLRSKSVSRQRNWCEKVSNGMTSFAFRNPGEKMEAAKTMGDDFFRCSHKLHSINRSDESDFIRSVWEHLLVDFWGFLPNR